MGNYLTFSSPSSFTLATNNGAKNWDGVLEYSTDTITWNEWDGTKTLMADSGKLYLRGIGNTVITGKLDKEWVLSGSNIACEGNIENLLDYAIVANGEHPTMGRQCYYDMFNACTSLINAPELPATTLVERCYAGMFDGCTSLVNAPELPATTLASWCCYRMFDGCTSLVNAPALPVTTLAEYCYHQMFNGCTSLVNAPELPATTLAFACYGSMFSACTSLINAPELPATTLERACYYYMFNGCTSLVNAPELPSTTLASSCYSSMFYGCTSLVNAPELPSTTLAKSCYAGMFRGCTSLTNAPALPATTLADSCYSNMFNGCTSLISIPALPATTLLMSCYGTMFKGCTEIKLSATQTEEYTTPYRIPTDGTGTTATDALTDMFYNTGGTFTGTPEINTTYYTSNEVIYPEGAKPKTIIIYNGKTIATLEAGQTATIKTANTEVDYDIIVMAGIEKVEEFDGTVVIE